LPVRLLHARGAGLGLALLLIGCAGPSSPHGYGPWEGERAASHIPAPDLSVTDVLGPVSGQGMEEMRRLDHQRDTVAIRLRRAFILVETGRHTLARTELNRLLFSQTPPSVPVEAFARYIRARSYAATGEADRAQADLERATALATASDLRTLIAAERPAAAPAPTPPVAAAPRVDLAFLPRSGWGARAPVDSRMVPMGRVFRLTVHHSGLLAGRGASDESAAAISSIQKTHMGGNGWGDIGYHYLIDPDGRVWQGRPVQWQGAHAGDPERNRGNIGICLLGNFVRGRDGQEPPPAQLRALQQLVVGFCRQYGIPAAGIYTHREMRVTTCPGEHLQLAVERLRRSLDGLAQASGG
jgi:hypothetical protein